MKLLKVILIVLAIVLIGLAGWFLLQRYNATYGPAGPIGLDTVVYSESTPDERRTDSACGNYVVPDDQPRKIEIPSVGIDNCIQKVGVDQNGAIAVPSNVHLAGWFVDSAVPGAKGLSIIDGHVLGRYGDAIFVNLHKLVPGNRVNIQMGDLSYKSFEVVDSNNYSVEDAQPKIFEMLGDVDSQLTLITCFGTFDAQSQTYDQRLIVRAKLIE